MWQHLEESLVEVYHKVKDESNDTNTSESSNRKEEPASSPQPMLI